MARYMYTSIDRLKQSTSCDMGKEKSDLYLLRDPAETTVVHKRFIAGRRLRIASVPESYEC